MESGHEWSYNQRKKAMLSSKINTFATVLLVVLFAGCDSSYGLEDENNLAQDTASSMIESGYYFQTHKDLGIYISRSIEDAAYRKNVSSNLKKDHPLAYSIIDNMMSKGFRVGEYNYRAIEGEVYRIGNNSNELIRRAEFELTNEKTNVLDQTSKIFNSSTTRAAPCPVTSTYGGNLKLRGSTSASYWPFGDFMIFTAKSEHGIFIGDNLIVPFAVPFMQIDPEVTFTTEGSISESPGFDGSNVYRISGDVAFIQNISGGFEYAYMVNRHDQVGPDFIDFASCHSSELKLAS